MQAEMQSVMDEARRQIVSRGWVDYGWYVNACAACDEIGRCESVGDLKGALKWLGRVRELIALDVELDIELTYYSD